MKHHPNLAYSVVATSFLLLFIIVRFDTTNAGNSNPVASNPGNGGLFKYNQDNSHCSTTVVFVLCKLADTKRGKEVHSFTLQLRQLIVALKSIALAERYTENVLGRENMNRCVEIKLVVSNRHIFENVETILRKWDPKFRNFLKLTYVPAIYPPGYRWMERQYRPCATMRLFLERILSETDSVIYADTDIVFLKSVQHLWAEFAKFGEETVAAMTPDLYRKQKLEINGYDPHAYNSGIMLMNLTRMRAMDWSERLGMVSMMFLKDAKFGDQDMLALYFKRFPDQIQNLSCDWNFTPRSCGFGRLCARDGISSVHGVNKRFFVKGGGLTSFVSFFRAFEQLDLGRNFSLNEFVHHLQHYAFNSTSKEFFCDAPQNFAHLVVKSIQRFSLFKDSPHHENIPTISEEGHKQPPLSLDGSAVTGKVVKTHLKKPLRGNTECITVALTLCEPPFQKGDLPSHHFNQTLVILKSMVLMERLQTDPKCIKTLIQSENRSSFNRLVTNIKTSWHSNYSSLLEFKFIQVRYPKDMVWMKRIYAPCATLPLTYTELHPELDVVMHLDTDLIFARPPSELWAEFNRFSPNTLMMMAPEINSAKLEQESKKYYWPTKYQAGLILMNLTRMRSVSFATRVKTISTIFREELKLPVQVVLTVYFHHFPEQITFLDCGWNILPHYCQTAYQPKCQSISVIHGCLSAFGLKSRKPLFRKIFLFYQEINMKNPAPSSLIRSLVGKLDSLFSNWGKLGIESSCAMQFFHPKFINGLKKWAFRKK